MARRQNYLLGREESGQICNRRTNGLQGEREAAQKRTFTRWINAHLGRSDLPMEVVDLFTDIQDGRVLMALLEELSGCKLLYRFRPSSHRIFRLNNIAKALAFLDDRHVKLLGIDASSIADAVPTAVLGLIWNIILFFQIKEATAGLQKGLSSSLSSLSVSSHPSTCDLSPIPCDPSHSSTLPSKGRGAAGTSKYHGKAINTLLHWVQRCTLKFGVEVCDFGKSWTSGLAFLALIKSIDPGLVDLRESLSREPRANMEEAFRVAQHNLGIPAILEPDDVVHCAPDEQCIITYVSQFLKHHPSLDEDNCPDLETRINLWSESAVQPTPKTLQLTPVESDSSGHTSPSQPEVQTLPKSQEKTKEQLLWIKWTNCPSAEFKPAPSPLLSELVLSTQKPMGTARVRGSNATTTETNKDSSDSVEETAKERVYGELYADEGNFSQSSEEEGMYTLSSTLDSDEEDAYSYILDLNKEASGWSMPSDRLYSEIPRPDRTARHDAESVTRFGTDLGLRPKVETDGEPEWDSQRHTEGTDIQRRGAAVLKERTEDEAKSKEQKNSGLDPRTQKAEPGEDHGDQREIQPIEEQKRDEVTAEECGAGSEVRVRWAERRMEGEEEEEEEEDRAVSAEELKDEEERGEHIEEEEEEREEHAVTQAEEEEKKKREVEEEDAREDLGADEVFREGEVPTTEVRETAEARERFGGGGVAATEEEERADRESERGAEGEGDVNGKEEEAAEKEGHGLLNEEEEEAMKGEETSERRHLSTMTREENSQNKDIDLQQQRHYFGMSIGSDRCQKKSGERVYSEALAPSSGETASELEVLFILWVSLYCFFLFLPQLNLCGLF